MKIAFFTDSYYPMLNGVTVSVEHFAKEMRALGHTVYIFAPKFDGHIDKEKDVYRLKSFRFLSTDPGVHVPFLLPHHYLTQIQPRDFDIIHAHGNGFFSLLGYQLAKMKGIPFFMTFHTDMARYVHYLLNGKVITPSMAAKGLRISANICDVVISPSHKMKKELLAYGVKKPIEVVPNFIYPERFTKAEKGYLHNLCAIPKDAPILLSVGRLGIEKNFLFLLDAFKKIIEKEALPHLVIVGDGDEAQNIKDYAQKIGLDGRVHFPGKIEQKKIAMAYADAEIFLFSSRTETQGIVLLEAAASGLPFVVVRDSAYKGMIIDNENGYQVSANIALFAEKVIELLGDKEKKKIFGKRSRELVQENFKPQQVAEDMVFLYQEALINKKPRRISLKRFNSSAWKRLYKTTEILDRIFE